MRSACLLLLVSFFLLCCTTPLQGNLQDSAKSDVAHRKDKISLEIEPGTYKLELIDSEFKVGSAIATKYFCETNSQYYQVIVDHFNIVTFENDLKKRNWERSKKNEGFYQRRNVNLAFDMLDSLNIELRGHRIMEAPSKKLAKDITDKKRYKQELIRHIVEKVNVTKDYIDTWDFNNHSARTSLEDFYGFGIYKEIQDTILAIHPKCKFFVNEGRTLSYSDTKNRAEAYKEKIDRMLKAGVQLDGIGFMGHFKDDAPFSYDEIKQMLDDFSTFDLPILITEFDFRFSKDRLTSDLTKKEAKWQAEESTKLLKLFFYTL